MQLIETVSEWKKIRKEISKNNLSVGFVPTMGNLHVGHLSLLEKSKTENEISVLSIFVNPTQFNNKSDLENYPRTLETDFDYARTAKIDYVFMPKYEEIYPDHYNFKVSELSLSHILEGAFRPGHFDGMLTIVLKLLLIINPTRAYFGEKDYQQLQLVKNMVQAFFLETEIISCPTIRLKSGLPYSSRNGRFSEEQFKQAQLFPKIFHSNKNCYEIKDDLIRNGFEVDYVEDYLNRRLAAVKLNDIRLIDNIELMGVI